MSWTDDAPCRELDPDLFFPSPEVALAGYAGVRRVCAACPVRTQCLDYAMAMEGNSDRFHRSGMWGGLTPGERAALHKTQVAVA
jgi:WhiB family transcriptional regulator, redox-sensing transcriptional regulator